jgi:hypothetical protein
MAVASDIVTDSVIPIRVKVNDVIAIADLTITAFFV